MVETASGKSISESGLITPFVASGAEVLSDLQSDKIERSMHYLETLTPRFAKLFEHVDLLLTPVSHVICLRLEGSLRDARWTKETADSAIRHLQFTAPVDFAGCPAISVLLNIGLQSNLPVGSHLVAPIGKERRLLEVSYELEASVNWKHKLGRSATS